jgi:hypothetical protein
LIGGFAPVGDFLYGTKFLTTSFFLKVSELGKSNGLGIPFIYK